MLKMFAISILFLVAPHTNAAQWFTLNSDSLKQIELIEEGVHSFAEEGVYFKATEDFPVALDCSKKDFVAIVDEKMADRALSLIMYAISTGKSVQFYVDSCTNEYPRARSVMLVN